MTKSFKRGSLTIYTGGMFAGKTDAMLTDFERASFAKKSFICFKPEGEERFGANIVKSRSKNITVEATVLPVNGTEEDLKKVLELTENIDVVGFDEVQFFGTWIVELASKLRKMGKRVVANGLDMDCYGKHFETTSALMGISDKPVKFHAVCVCCGEDATYSQKLINGEPVKGDTPIVDVEDVSGTSKVTYEARCVNCFVSPEEA